MAQDSLQSQDEQELQFKKRARRRLVGSITLVVLMILILPMILEDRTAQGPKNPLNVSMAVQPSEHNDNGIESLGSDNSLPPDMEIPPAIPEPVQGANIEETQQQLSAVKNVPAIKNDVAIPAASDAKPIQESKPVAPVKPAVETPKKEALSPALNDKPSEKYFIKVGVFSDANNVKKIQDKLTNASLKSYTEITEAANGKLTRIIVGDFRTKLEAEDKLSKIKSLGYAGAVVGHSQ
jgi:DedD protein